MGLTQYMLEGGGTKPCDASPAAPILFSGMIRQPDPLCEASGWTQVSWQGSKEKVLASAAGSGGSLVPML